MISRSVRGALALLALGLTAATADAQQGPPSQLEARLDAFTRDPWAVHAGFGATAPLGMYVRWGLVAGFGAGERGWSGRTDLVARFTLDPFREKRWAPYGVGGVSARYGAGSGQFVLLMVGVEGPMRSGVAPAIELGFGGGFRAGLIVRQAFPRRR